MKNPTPLNTVLAPPPAKDVLARDAYRSASSHMRTLLRS
jgi:hypothetical protein